MTRTMKGEAVPIVLAKEDHVFELDEHNLETILSQEHVRDKNIVVVSVAGVFRKGKSFLLDFFLRYLNAMGSPQWIGEEDEPLTGFPWRGGCERDTTGILFWSEVFVVPLPNGEQVAVLLMDTQGAFDSDSTVKDCATIFALSTMTSSVQVYNLMNNIQEDNLQHLQLFTEYGRLALENTSEKPFQKLLFLVRDWSYPYDAEYGSSGGRKVLEKKLKICDRQHPELQRLRQHIYSCFDKIDCFLLPYPGPKVATTKDFNGCLQDIAPEFKDHLKTLVPLILAPENLVTKVINGRRIKAKELIEYFKAYINIFKGDELPEPKSMLQATAEANNLAAVASAKDLYSANMEKICGGERPYINGRQLEVEHFRIRDEAVDLFVTTRKMGGTEFSQPYLEKLEQEIEETYENFKKHNESKNVFAAARTPAVLFAWVIIMYFASGIFGVVGIYSMANFCNILMGASLLTLCLWAYIRYSGEMTELGSQIDIGASLMWIHVLKPAYHLLAHDRTLPDFIQTPYENGTGPRHYPLNGKTKAT